MITNQRELAKAITADLAKTISDLGASYPDATSPINSLSYLLWACEIIQENSQTWEIDKLHRWVGWVQGMLNGSARTTLREERERVKNAKNELEDKEQLSAGTESQISPGFLEKMVELYLAGHRDFSVKLN